jgi:hypothetical protein
MLSRKDMKSRSGLKLFRTMATSTSFCDVVGIAT